jgi:hypothetical protein
LGCGGHCLAHQSYSFYFLIFGDLMRRRCEVCP